MARSVFRTVLVIGDNHEELIKKYSADTKVERYVKCKLDDAEKLHKSFLKLIEAILDSKELEISETQRENYKKLYLNIKEMTDFEMPQSRNEAILQNLLGANNKLEEPQSRVEAILQAILGGQEYTEEAMSRIEELLLCILNNEDTDMVPVSRNEEILIAKIKGNSYDKEPQSRIEELLIGWLSAIEGNIIDDQNRDIITDENKKLYAR